MPDKQWKVKIDDTSHKVKIEHGSMVRHFAVHVDGKQVNLLENVPIEQGNRLSFKINDHLCHILVLMSRGSTFEYDFVLDGYSIQSNQKVELPTEMKREGGFLKPFFINTLVGVLLIIVVGYLSGNVTKPGTNFAKMISSGLILLAVALFLFVTLKKRSGK